MKKVFASDFDGTLYFYKAPDPDKLPEASVKKILEYQSKGGLFGLCTGRQLGGLLPFTKGHFEPDFFITSSGANIIDRGLNEIQKRGVDREVAASLIKLARERTKKTGQYYRLTLDIEGDICVFEKMDYPGKYYVITGIEDAPQGLIHQVSIHTEAVEDAQAIVDEVNGRFGDHVEAFRNVIEVDIAPKGCSKGKGVEVLRRHMGDCRLYGIGDSMNDLPLIEACDVSYTFPYAPEALQAVATKVVPTIVDALDDSMGEAL